MATMKMKHIKETEAAPVKAGNCPYDGNPVRRDSVMSGGVMVDGVICTHCEAEWTWHAWQREQSKAKPAPVQVGNEIHYCTCGHTEDDHIEGLGVGACWNGSGSGNRCECREYNPVQDAAPVSGQHTPTPWFIEGDAIWCCDTKGEYQRVCIPCDMTDGTTNAAFIVKACNCHDELVRALQDLLSADQMPPCEKQTELAIVAMKQARAALNKASR